MTPSPALKVCLVENHDDSREVLGMLLTQLGHEVAFAESMGSALEVLKSQPFDVLVSDIGLPDGDGWQLLNQLGDRRPPCCIAISGYGMARDRQRSAEAGFQHHLVKPADVKELQSVLRDVARSGADAMSG